MLKTINLSIQQFYVFFATFNYSLSSFTLNSGFYFSFWVEKLVLELLQMFRACQGYSFLTKSMFLHASIKRWNLFFCVLLLGQHILYGLNSMFSSDFGKHHNYDSVFETSTPMIKEMFSLSHKAFICKWNAIHSTGAEWLNEQRWGIYDSDILNAVVSTKHWYLELVKLKVSLKTLWWSLK